MEKENKHINGHEPDEALLFRYIREEASIEEQMKIEDWLSGSEEREKLLIQLASIDYVLRTKKRIEARDSLKAYTCVEKHIKISERRKWINKACLVAACFVGVLVMSTVISYWMQSGSKEDTQRITVQANSGVRTSFNLPDGTIVYLNSGSQLSYSASYNKEIRGVTLTGEAYFKVKYNPAKPFIVSVANNKMRVKVLGTEFNLQSYKEENIVQTTLVTGAVNIEMIRNGRIVSDVKLKPSEKAIYDISSGIVSILTVNTEYETAWKDGRLMFKDMPLPQVLKRLTYFYNVEFEVKDPVINSYCFTGVFENKQLSQILDYLKISSRVNYTINHATSDDSLKVQHTIVTLQKE